MYYGSVRSFGIVARGWSRTGVGYASATSATAYGLYANVSGVYPSNGPNYRYYGFPVRPLCRGSVPIFLSGRIATATRWQLDTELRYS